jgi:hypothetical protein
MKETLKQIKQSLFWGGVGSLMDLSGSSLLCLVLLQNDEFEQDDEVLLSDGEKVAEDFRLAIKKSLAA